MKNHLTPIEKIFFRTHNIYILATGVSRSGITEIQQKDLDRYNALLTEPQGLTPTQQKDLDTWEKKLSDGKELTEAQYLKYNDYKSRLVTPVGLSKNQKEDYDYLIEKKNRPAELTKGAKNLVYQVWLKYRRDYDPIIIDDKLEKGILGEEDAISLISIVDGITYYKNTKRISKNNLTGECDIVKDFKDVEYMDKVFDRIRVIQDAKCKWSPSTFNNSELTTEYEWQGRGYMYLFDGDVFRLRPCLINMPPEIFNRRWTRLCFNKGINDDSLPEYREYVLRFFREHIYDFESFFNTEKSNLKVKYPDVFYKVARELEPLWTHRERVKTFEFERDYDKEADMLEGIRLGVEEFKRLDREHGIITDDCNNLN